MFRVLYSFPGSRALMPLGDYPTHEAAVAAAEQFQRSRPTASVSIHHTESCQDAEENR